MTMARARLTSDQRDKLMNLLRVRFEKNRARHEGVDWKKVQARLEGSPDKLWSLYEMESTGGEPDVVAVGKPVSAYTFIDCSVESPQGRRSLCYDREALDSRKEAKPQNSALDVASAMGAEILTEELYRELQVYGEFDTKTSSWIQTPASIRKLGGALFCDRRYGTVFVYHNGAQSYYAARGFRALLKV
jgi:hypothetical protein